MNTRHVCLACRLRYSRQTVSAIEPLATERIVPTSRRNVPKFLHDGTQVSRRFVSTSTEQRKARSKVFRPRIGESIDLPSTSSPTKIADLTKRWFSEQSETQLSSEQRTEIGILTDLRAKLNGIVHSQLKVKVEERNTVTVEAALRRLSEIEPEFYGRLKSTDSFATTEQNFLNLPVRDFSSAIDAARMYRDPAKIVDPASIENLYRLGILSLEYQDQTSTDVPVEPVQSSDDSTSTAIPGSIEFEHSPDKAPQLSDYQEGEDEGQPKTPGESVHKDYEVAVERIAELDSNLLQSFKAEDEPLQALAQEEVKVPQLSFDLSRVLFNPGIYHLQDPRSRVYNFDPYLEKLMPVAEFNFDALNKYVTSSEDALLRDLAVQHGKRYIGSSSSLSGALCHFHFLLSAWRKLDFRTLSRGFGENLTTFTKFYRGPTAIFMKYQNGTYAVDADKEFDSANILTSLGRSMEKLLTLEKPDFEQFRKTPGEKNDFAQSDPEQYHYGEIGPFLMRSQLDAYDPRLPGTGMFDLKTRAVLGIRMSMEDYKRGVGYQIKDRFGTWDSYEREFFDMGRAAFLKYSLQVRMGRMDGIFVAYHNVERMFGFQYIPISEMDRVLHGTTDRTLGDREFSLSIRLLGEIFDRATKRFPQQSLRFHFETREQTAVHEPVPYMYIFAEAVTDEQISNIQDIKKAEIAAIEAKLLEPQSEEKLPTEESSPASTTTTFSGPSIEAAMSSTTTTPHSSAANTGFLDSISNITLPTTEIRPILAYKLIIRNKINDVYQPRPSDLTSTDSWTLEYTLTEFDAKQAKEKYIQCKNRRSAASLIAKAYNDYENNSFMKSLRLRSEEGARWRKQMDEEDEKRGEKVVLYPEKL